MKSIGYIKIEPYKGREVRLDQEVWIYRNLMRTDGPWYSLMQRGLVVGHTRGVTLTEVRFVVREEGRQRCIREQRKNVHAFVVGKLAPRGCCGTEPGREETLGVELTYNPYKMQSFQTKNFTPQLQVFAAAFCVLNSKGCSVAYLEKTLGVGKEAA